MGKDKKQSSKKGAVTNIYLNVYDLTPINDYLYWFGLGIFHSGIEVHGLEYGYGAHEYPTSGVFEVEPRLCPGFLFRQSVRIGTTNMPQSDFQNFIQDLASKYHGNSYHLISKNCNHFTEEVAMYLTGKPIPPWINRLARLGSLFNCLLPDGIQVSQVRHVPSQNRGTASEGSESTVSSIIDDEDDLLLMAPRLSNFSSSSSSTSTSTSNSNGNSNSNSNANSNSDCNSNAISNSHSRSHSHSHSPSHSHARSHSGSVFNSRDKDQPPKLAKVLM
ncbi:deSI-like protein At4g17486 [Carex rostrata]